MEKFLEFIQTNFGQENKDFIQEVLNNWLLKVENGENIAQKGVDIASILSPLKLDIDTYFACLVLPFVREGKCVLDEATEKKLKNSLSLVDAVINISNFDYSSDQVEMESLRNMLLAIAKDIRVMIIRLAEVLYLARHSKDLDKSVADHLHFEIKQIYSPLAARLGLSFIKSELNDLNLYYYKPVEYKKLLKQVAEDSRNGDERIAKTVDKIKSILAELNIKGDCYGRVKHISSLYKKLYEKHKTLSQIFDLCAIRVLVPSKNDCYAVLGAIHTEFTSIDNRFKDYVARPKINGYQSLHTVILVDDEPLEVQIRTFEMHDHAEYGVAAHFLYKEHKNKLDSFDDKLLWIRKLLEDKDTSAGDLIDNLKTDVYSGEIFVQTPMGKIIQLDENATPIDFAYAIHSAVGNKCVGARINGKMMPLSTELNNGDVVEIITNQNAKGPSRDWLKIAKTSQARNKINQFFRHEMKEENIKKGKSILELAAKNKNFTLKELLETKNLVEALEKYAFHNMDELYASVGYGSLTSTQIINKLIDIYYREHPQEPKEVKLSTQKSSSDATDIDGLEGIMVKYAKCCSPIPGDEILGFVSRGNGVTIHRADCPALKSMEQDRIMPIEWGEKASENKNYNASIRLFVENGTGVLATISNKIAENKINITKIESKNHTQDEAIIDLSFFVQNKQQLDDFCNKLRALSIVHSIVRGNN